MRSHISIALITSMLTIPTHGGGNDRQTNRLAKEKSPYLLQHAENPVDWFPWGDEAFAKAREQNKPIFLSVGYSTCHWCHVMAHESFENPEIAAVMNKHFINIKLDREERPDVDQVYMTFVQATTGSGGWPMSVWLTPELKPFVGGTYFPPDSRHGRPGFKSVLEQLAGAWETDEASIRKSAGDVTDKLRQFAATGSQPAANLPPATLLDDAFSQLANAYDAEHGGFGAAPKFPRPANFDFLHHYARLGSAPPESREQAITMAARTLAIMARGGIHDHVGGGFHRYSVDRFWHIPHYEKMLYDQAQIAVSCLDAARLSGDPSHAQTARDILAYVSRKLTSPGGGFYSAEDADSLPSRDSDHKTEGAFYVWKESETDSLLGDDAPLFKAAYGIEPGGNAPAGSDPHGELTGTNTLFRRQDDAALATQFKHTQEQVSERLANARKTLFDARENRPHPHLDDKIITAWNGLMISAFARAHQNLGDPAHLATATRAATFIRENLYDPPRGVLLRSYREGPAAIDGFAADYAFLIRGLLDLYQAGFDIQWLRWAQALQNKQDELFLDSEHGGYFASTGKDPSVLLRTKEAYDGAEPSENSVSAHNLLRLSVMLAQPERRRQAELLIRAFAPQLANAPTSSPGMLAALSAVRTKPAQIVIAGKPDAPDTLALLRIARDHAGPDRVVLLADGGPGQAFLAEHADFYQNLAPTDGGATAYVCHDFVCQLPTTDPQQLKSQLIPTLDK